MNQQAAARSGRINAVLVAAGQWHDIDYARLQLLTLLGEDPRVRVRVFEDFENTQALADADFLISYTCNVVPSLAAQEALSDWLNAGGRWFALHGTNSILRAMSGGRWFDTPDWAPLFSDTLGSRFRAHPVVKPYRVDVAAPEHPLVAGIEPFMSNDEQYLVDTCGDIEVLLDTHFEGETPGFKPRQWPASRHPVLYIKQHAAGAVLYLTLGHCRHHYDMQPLMDFWPTVDRSGWETPEYRLLLQRGLAWSMEPVDQVCAKAFADLKKQHQQSAG